MYDHKANQTIPAILKDFQYLIRSIFYGRQCWKICESFPYIWLEKDFMSNQTVKRFQHSKGQEPTKLRKIATPEMAYM